MSMLDNIALGNSSERLFKSELANSSSAHKTGDVNRRRLIHRAKTKSLRISVVIVVAFVLWWTPYYIMMIIFMFLNPDKHDFWNCWGVFSCSLRLSTSYSLRSPTFMFVIV
ncbi:hypothetical protein TSAR_006516 [Trichomalopsis sarcophagae]|uniref:G-protein coupled receptors family 1 profile domain-containing protein n=1 Tax=Trichomalopsis sarcophagae TaxID=543379 RepID=A0A232ESB1_9HYME|nr:hypothetical protein TSAR_006516 [Trichomalopsis sarcophagae]